MLPPQRQKQPLFAGTNVGGRVLDGTPPKYHQLGLQPRVTGNSGYPRYHPDRTKNATGKVFRYLNWWRTRSTDIWRLFQGRPLSRNNAFSETPLSCCLYRQYRIAPFYWRTDNSAHAHVKLSIHITCKGMRARHSPGNKQSNAVSCERIGA